MAHPRESKVKPLEARVSHPDLLTTGEQHYCFLLERLEACSIFMLDQEGKITSWNKACENLIGYTEAEIIGQNVSVLYTEEEAASTDQKSQLKEAAIKGRVEYEGWRVKKDGSRFWAEIILTPVRDESGTLKGFVKLTRDITEQKRQQQELANLLQREKFARQEAERAGEVIRRLLSVTSGVFSHLSISDLLNQLLLRILDLLDAETAVILLIDETGQYLVPRAAIGLEEEVIRGEKIPINAGLAGRIASQSGPLLIDDLSKVEIISPVLKNKGIKSLVGAPMIVEGRTIGVIHLGVLYKKKFNLEEARLLQRVADRAAVAIEHARLYESERNARLVLEERVEQRTEELQEINSELNSFAYTIAHDLRAPLRAIESFSNAVVEDFSEVLDERGNQYLSRIALAASKMDRMITELLEYSKVSRTRLALEEVDMEEVIDEAITELKDEIEKTGAGIEIKRPLGRVLGHRSTLVNVFRNLISNALKFIATGQSPQVYLFSEMVDGYLRLFVVDNGIGVPYERRELIFKLFERLHSDDSYSGTGVGLAIVSRAVEKMGGRVGVESNSNGSTFWVDLRALPSMA
jgi:PAS domain S-box-containing protein